MRFAICALVLGLSITHVDGVALAKPEEAARPTVPGLDPMAPRADSAIAPLDRLEVTVFREPELSVADLPVDETADAEVTSVERRASDERDEAGGLSRVADADAIGPATRAASAARGASRWIRALGRSAVDRRAPFRKVRS